MRWFAGILGSLQRRRGRQFDTPGPPPSWSGSSGTPRGKGDVVGRTGFPVLGVVPALGPGGRGRWLLRPGGEQRRSVAARHERTRRAATIRGVVPRIMVSLRSVGSDCCGRPSYG